MPPAGPDRALERLVSELSQVSTDDIEAILDDLTEDQRSRVRRLLQHQLGQADPQAEEPAEPVRPSLRLKGLSPWLSSRLDRATGQPSAPTPGRRALLPRPETPAFEMTAHALAMLLESAETVARTGGDAAGPSAPDRRPLLPEPWTRLFGGGRR